MNIRLKKAHVIGYEKTSGTTAVALDVVANIKDSLEGQLNNELRMEIDYKTEGMHEKTLFHLCESKSRMQELFLSAFKKRQPVLSVSIGSCGEWAMNDINCRINNPKVYETVHDTLQQYADQHALVLG